MRRPPHCPIPSQGIRRKLSLELMTYVDISGKAEGRKLQNMDRTGDSASTRASVPTCKNEAIMMKSHFRGVLDQV